MIQAQTNLGLIQPCCKHDTDWSWHNVVSEQLEHDLSLARTESKSQNILEPT